MDGGTFFKELTRLLPDLFDSLQSRFWPARKSDDVTGGKVPHFK